MRDYFLLSTYHWTRAERIWRIVLMICLVSLIGCSEKVRYSPGFYTRTIEGTLRLEVDGDAVPFIVARKYHRTFLETSRGNLKRVTASLIHPDENGFYTIAFDSEVTRIDAMFYAEGYQTDSFRFDKTLGVGTFTYDVKMKRDGNWKNSFFLLVKTTLMEYVTEPRFLMSQVDKLFIGKWITQVEKRL